MANATKQSPRKLGDNEILTIGAGRLKDGQHLCKLDGVYVIPSKYRDEDRPDLMATKIVFECIAGAETGQQISKTVGDFPNKGTSYHTLLEQMGLEVDQVGARIPIGQLMGQSYDVLVGIASSDGNDDSDGFGGFVIESVRPAKEAE